MPDRRLQLSLLLEQPAVQTYMMQAVDFVDQIAGEYRAAKEWAFREREWAEEGRDREREYCRWADDGGCSE
jgi:hypothetical protein